MNTDPRLIAFARQMRRKPTAAEKLAWRLSRSHRLAGFRFRRQHPVPPYIADFYCAVAGLVVELDGESHVGQEENDRVRQEILESQGLKVLRFWNSEVIEDPDAFTRVVYRWCVERTKADPVLRDRFSEWGHFLPPTPARDGSSSRRIGSSE